MRYRIVNPDGPVRAECAATYLADNLLPDAAYAFVFRVLDSDTRFTVYASAADRYVINGIYRLTISEPTDVPLYLPVDEANSCGVACSGSRTAGGKPSRRPTPGRSARRPTGRPSPATSTSSPTRVATGPSAARSAKSSAA
jgi:hypothetical protein